MSEADVEMSFVVDPVRVEFSDPGLEREFQQHHLRTTRASLRVTLVFCSLFYLAFSLTDLAALGYGTSFLVLLLGRITVALTACGGLYLIRRKTESVLAHRAVASAAEVVGMAIFMLVVWFRPGELPWHAMSLCIMLIVIYVFIPNRLITAIGIALGATAAFIALAVIRGESRFSDEVTMAMLLLLTNSFGIIAARRYHRLWRDEYRALSTLKALSIRDHLTACFNRRHLHTTLLPQVLERARAERRWLTLMVCDIDHFKRVNDNHGHQGGDAVLMHVAMLLQDRIHEPRDSVVRYGGEEFLLVMPQMDFESAASLAEDMRAAVAGSEVPGPDGKSMRATVSIGVLSVDFSASDTEVTESALIAAADMLLYEAKRAGRNSIRTRLWADMVSSHAVLSMRTA
ncbi:putative signaling protein (GGDEF domain) (plasmid) [Cupriavidus metallidurans CH34]|uniref:diguanylate cyclase n=2 Tax=Cupriavidus metallidurans TaxID=119219 RepID=Q1LD73_CUPMC|nr:putative signaling protein (GGDEF domain) [Cupriavidus metallidurans CH34]